MRRWGRVRLVVEVSGEIEFVLGLGVCRGAELVGICRCLVERVSCVRGKVLIPRCWSGRGGRRWIR